MPRYYSHLKYVAIELTNHCNLQCSKCWSQNPQLRHPRVKGYMTPKLFRKVTGELAEDPEYHSVALHYAGESTLHPRFAEFCRKASTCKFGELTLATNAVALTTEHMQAITASFSMVAVSLHNSPYLQQAIENLHALKDMGCSLRANVVQSEFSFSGLKRLRGKLRDVKIREIPAITEDMKSSMPRTRFYPLCTSMYSYMAVLWNGDTLPCCHLLSSGDWSLGNVTEKRLIDVFRGYKWRRLRRGHQKDTPCESCEVRR